MIRKTILSMMFVLAVSVHVKVIYASRSESFQGVIAAKGNNNKNTK